MNQTTNAARLDAAQQLTVVCHDSGVSIVHMDLQIVNWNMSTPESVSDADWDDEETFGWLILPDAVGLKSTILKVPQDILLRVYSQDSTLSKSFLMDELLSVHTTRRYTFSQTKGGRVLRH